MSLLDLNVETSSDGEFEAATVAEPIKVLVVDDSPIDRRWVGGLLRRRANVIPVFAGSGIEAIERLERDRPSIVLTDLRMPQMDGLGLVEVVRDRFPPIPVILMTAHGSEEIALNALRQGAASYVPKRRLARELLAVIDQVLDSMRAGGRRRTLRRGAIRSTLEFRLENDPKIAQDLIARFREETEAFELFDKNAAMRVDIALQEALLNGIYHGNLEVGSELREDGEGPFLALAEERRGLSPYRERRLRVVAEIDRTRAEFIVEDEGPGFDPTKLPDPLDPANLERTGGRGLLLIRTFMDEVVFNASGNRLTMTKKAGRRDFA